MPPATVRSARFGPVLVDYDPRVLTPRAWTLDQSRWAAELAATGPPGPILELCAGAGHIGLAAAVLADRDLVQVEAEPVAAGYAVANAARAGWAARVEVRVERLERAMRAGERFPLVVADPPYLRTDEVEAWPDDPVSAIDGGADGLDVTRAILTVAASCLPAGGPLLLQVAGPVQADDVVTLAEPDFRRGGVRTHDARRAVLLLLRR